MKLQILILLLTIPIMAMTEFHLPDGVIIKGEILKANSNNYVVNLGYQVLTIPTDKIVKKIDIKKGEVTTKTEDGLLYHQKKDQDTKSIKDHVPTLGESVVIVNTPSGLGSGFIINKDGYLITNYHVIEKEKNIKVTMFVKNKKTLEKVVYTKIKIISFNPFMDLALLKIEDESKKDFPYVLLGNMDVTNSGDTVFAIGNPLGLERSVSQGIISSTDRNYRGLLYIQTTAPINPGNSGGPLFNLKGEVIGVTNMGYVFSDGLGFAIPINYVKYFINHREAFYYNEYNYNSGVRYLEPPK